MELLWRTEVMYAVWTVTSAPCCGFSSPILLSLGLDAAKSFIERYAAHLEEVDLTFLTEFAPLQDSIIEKFSTRPELALGIQSGMCLTEYLKEAPPQDARLFIWTLEEHRDEYISCCHILDDYFDVMGTRLYLFEHGV